MQPFTTSADKTLTGLRPDTTDKARMPARAAGAEPGGAPFGAVFDASAERSGRGEPALVQFAKTANDPDAVTSDGKAETRASGSEVEDAPDAPDLATNAAPGEPDDPPAGEITTRHSTDADPRATETEAVDALQSDAPDRNVHATAVTTPDREASTRIVAAGGAPSGNDIQHASEHSAGAASLEIGSNRTPQGISASEASVRGTAPDRQSSPTPTQTFKPPAPDTANRASVTAQSAPPGFASDLGGPAKGNREAELAAGREAVVRGQDGARPTSPTGGPVLANASSPAVLHGGTANMPHHKTALSAAASAIFADGAGVEGAEKGRDPDAPLGLEPRGTGGSGASSQTFTTLPRSELPQTIAMQITAAIQKGGPGVKPGIELTLSPEELGRVRLTFTQSDTGVTVNVHADRAETLELLRRNIDTLAQEFLDIGYDSADFTFGRDDAEAQTTARSAELDDADLAAGNTQTAPDAPTPILLVSDRLDIRL